MEMKRLNELLFHTEYYASIHCQVCSSCTQAEIWPFLSNIPENLWTWHDCCVCMSVLPIGYQSDRSAGINVHNLETFSLCRPHEISDTLEKFCLAFRQFGPARTITSPEPFTLNLKWDPGESQECVFSHWDVQVQACTAGQSAHNQL